MRQAAKLLTLAMLAVLIVLPVAPASADRDDQQQIGELAEAFLLPRIFAIMSEEGIVSALEMQADMLDGRGGAAWRRQAEAIYDAGQIEAAFMQRFAAELGGNHDAVTASLRFARSPAGVRVLELEVTARAALLDRDVEDAARDRVDEMRALDDPLLGLVQRRIDANDLIEANVAAGMNTNLAFHLAFLDAAGPDFAMPLDEVLADVRAQEAEIREQAEDWMYGFLTLAFRPASVSDIEDYIAYAASPAGQAFHNAIFSAYESAFAGIATQLGRLAGGVLATRDL